MCMDIEVGGLRIEFLYDAGARSPCALAVDESGARTVHRVSHLQLQHLSYESGDRRRDIGIAPPSRVFDASDRCEAGDVGVLIVSDANGDGGYAQTCEFVERLTAGAHGDIGGLHAGAQFRFRQAAMSDHPFAPVAAHGGRRASDHVDNR